MAKAGRVPFASFVNTEVLPFHFSLCLGNYVAGPVCCIVIRPISLLLSGGFLLKCVERIKITSYFPCFSPHVSECFYGSFSLVKSEATKAIPKDSRINVFLTESIRFFVVVVVQVIQGIITWKIFVVILMSHAYFCYCCVDQQHNLLVWKSWQLTSQGRTDSLPIGFPIVVDWTTSPSQVGKSWVPVITEHFPPPGPHKVKK